MTKEDIQNLALAAAALGLAYAFYRVINKGVSTKDGKPAPAAPVEQGGFSWINGQPVYTSFAPFNSNTMGGKLAIQDLLSGTVGDWGYTPGFY